MFLDRDGVINEERSDYVKRWEEFRFLPGALEALALLTEAGFGLFVVTNQSAIGRGLVLAGDIRDIHRRMMAEIERAGGHIAQTYCCPHAPEDRCECRKPRPGLLVKAAREYGLELTRCYLIGDKPTDVIAGQAVGCQCVLVLSGLGSRPDDSNSMGARPDGVHVCQDINEAAAWVVQTESQSVSGVGSTERDGRSAPCQPDGTSS